MRSETGEAWGGSLCGASLGLLVGAPTRRGEEHRRDWTGEVERVPVPRATADQIALWVNTTRHLELPGGRAGQVAWLLQVGLTVAQRLELRQQAEAALERAALRELLTAEMVDGT